MSKAKHLPIRLDLRHADPDLPIRANLSSIEALGRCLFVGSDEGAQIERLTTDDVGTAYVDHREFKLSDFFDLPDGPDGEADIEGIAADAGWLWVAGSHALARRKPDRRKHSDREALERLTEVRRDPNRYLLARIPLVDEGDGTFTPVPRHAGRTAACVKMGAKRNKLAKMLRDDEHIGRFIEVPAKENGFDVEGLAVRGDRVFLGLRGPVLRGWACILELTVEETKPGRLGLVPAGARSLAYHKHFLDLDGLGIRELAFDHDDLLILSGPTMDLDGPVVVWRWTGALEATEQQVIPRDRLTRVIDLPSGVGYDHAEGIAVRRGFATGDRLLVAHDNPGDGRLHEHGTGIDLDAYPMPAAKS